MVAVAFTGFVDADNVRMLKMRRGFGFAAEPQYFLFARELSRENHLQRDDTIQTDLPRAIDDSHAAAPDFFEQFEVTEAARVFGRTGYQPVLPVSSAPSSEHCGQKPRGQYSGSGTPHSGHRLASRVFIRYCYRRKIRRTLRDFAGARLCRRP